MGLLKNIEWTTNNRNNLIYKVDMKNDYVSRGSNLTVREGQNAIFCHNGKMADVFLPGRYKLDTDNIPVLTTLMSWKYGFENPFRSDIYFVSTTQFPNQKWGTVNPIMIRDADYGAVRVRGFGSYSFRIKDAFVFLTELSGAHTSFNQSDITDYLRSMIVMGITDAIGEAKIPVLDMAANLMELSKIVQNKLQGDFEAMGLELVKFNFENFSLPPELEKAMDQNASYGIRKQNWGMHVQQEQLDAMKNAASNPGAGGVMGAGMGMGMGMGMGQMFGNMMGNNMYPNQNMNNGYNNQGYNNQGYNNQQQMQNGPTQQCSKCQSPLRPGAKFCGNCGTPTGVTCPKCNASLSPGAKFCRECGQKI